LETLLTYLKKTSRFPLSIQKGSQINNDLFNFMNSYLAKAQRQVFEYKDMKFYDQNSGSVKIYSVKSKLIDLYLLISVLMYLCVVYIYTKVITIFKYLSIRDLKILWKELNLLLSKRNLKLITLVGILNIRYLKNQLISNIIFYILL